MKLRESKYLRLKKFKGGKIDETLEFLERGKIKRSEKGVRGAYSNTPRLKNV